jgi:alpha-beta hydrolase superfamily lysophospholipase
MQNKTDIFTSTDGKKMFFQHWAPAGQPDMVIALVHGLGEHSTRYQDWAARFCSESAAFTAFDLRGHGSSEGRRGHFSSLEMVFNDIDLFLEKTAILFAGIPIVLYGHSLGGNLAANYFIRRKNNISALIITAPWLRLGNPPSPIVKALVKIASKIFPSFTASSGLDINNLSRDSSVLHEYRSDLLIHDRISVNTAQSAIEAGESAITRASDATVPVLVMHGTGDKITSPEGSRAFCENAGKNITLKLWDGFYHELHNEPGKAEVFEHISAWLKKNKLLKPRGSK